MVNLDRSTVLEVVDVMFIYIREASILNGDGSFPHRNILMDAVLDGMRNIFAYQAKYKVNISNRDSIKIFAFAIPQLNKRLKRLRLNGFDMSDDTAYMACMDFIANTYQHVDFNSHPDMKNTCRIISELADSGNDLVGYTYLKAVQETCLCARP